MAGKKNKSKQRRHQACPAIIKEKKGGKGSSKLKQEVERIRADLRWLKGKVTQEQVQPPQDNPSKGVKKLEKGETVTCFKCHKEGHKSYQCKEKMAQQKSKSNAKGKKKAMENKNSPKLKASLVYTKPTYKAKQKSNHYILEKKKNALSSRGFCPLWLKWMNMLVVGGSVGVCLNGEESAFFNPVGDVLSKMMLRTARAGLIKGLLTDLVPDDIFSLQYADDTIKKVTLENLKCILMWYERITGMRINFHKSEVLPIHVEPSLIHCVKHIMGCLVGEFPLKYLGLPLHCGKLSRDDVQPLVNKIMNRIAGWRGKLLSHARRVTLIKSCLSSIPVYLLSFIKFPKWAIRCLNSHMSNFLWNDSEGRGKYHLANWESVTMCKDFEGLGIPNLTDLNVCLLASWVKRYEADVGKLWREVINLKYKTSCPNLFASRDRGAAEFFKGMLWAAKAAKMGYRWQIGNEKKLNFGRTTEKQASGKLWNGINLKCTFRRLFIGDLMRVWEEVVQLASTIVFKGDEDSLIWQFSSNGVYSSQSLYKAINFRGISQVHSPAVWSPKIPPRIHFFLWLLSQNKVLTRDILAKRREVSDDRCLLCSEKESVQHLLFECIVAVNMWQVVSEALEVNIENNFLDVERRLEVHEGIDLAGCGFGSKLVISLSGGQKAAIARGGPEAEERGLCASEAGPQE
ncbi:hypothetical protein U9M48_043413 [Paspalum notatum var. saurae]|uniref:CCHC-type domain-containing protein n=1 Tax=Paspalum notatum var. saurae TaxID=547442 RepID=A0AAQ3XFJ0_PASNO